ncbi:hypothetical protein F5H01DRAFT_347365 [Linnemannia elongata]|nr:hypothetical protein F5H01DRAFT_347365 [Linnemannia elongata]
MAGISVMPPLFPVVTAAAAGLLAVGATIAAISDSERVTSGVLMSTRFLSWVLMTTAALGSFN